MSFDFYIWEIQRQTDAAIQMANEYQQFSHMLKTSINTFFNTPLSGKAYDSAKIYFSTVYPPLANAFVLACEAFIEAHKRLPKEFQAYVATTDVIEEQLKAQISQGQALLQKTSTLIDQRHTDNFGLEKRYMNISICIQKLQAKLTRLYEFNAYSAGLFSEYERMSAYLEAGLAEVENGTAFNVDKGIFELSNMNLEWISPIHAAWKERKKHSAIRSTDRPLFLNKRTVDLAVTGAQQFSGIKDTGTTKAAMPIIGTAIDYQKITNQKAFNEVADKKTGAPAFGHIQLGLSLADIEAVEGLSVAIHHASRKTVGAAIKTAGKWVGSLFI
jgi:hypothetical protein